MDALEPLRRTAWFSTALLMLILVGIISLTATPTLAHETRLAGLLVGVVVLFTLQRWAYGLAATLPLILAWLLVSPPLADSLIELRQQTMQLTGLALLGLTAVAMAAVDFSHFSKRFWVLLWAGMSIAYAILFLPFTPDDAATLPEPILRAAARFRLGITLLLPLVGLICVLPQARRLSIESSIARRRTIGAAITILLTAPLFGLGLASLATVGIHWGELWHQADFGRLLSDWLRWTNEAIKSAPPQAASAWKWLPHALLLPAMLLGWLASLRRGYRLRRDGLAPTMWLLSVYTLIVGSAWLVRLEGSLRDGEYSLRLLSVWLSLLTLTEMVMLVLERLILPAPPPGPADIPRVK